MAWLDERNAKMMPTKAQERPRALNMAKSLREMARLVKFHWSYICTHSSIFGWRSCGSHSGSTSEAFTDFSYIEAKTKLKNAFQMSAEHFRQCHR